MDYMKENLVKFLEEYAGNSSQFLLDRILEKLRIRDLHALDEDDKEDLMDALIDDVLSAFVSLQKQRMLRSRIKSILDGE